MYRMAFARSDFPETRRRITSSQVRNSAIAAPSGSVGRRGAPQRLTLDLLASVDSSFMTGSEVFVDGGIAQISG